MKTIFENVIYKEEIERSKFIGYLFHIENQDDLKTKIKEIQKEYPKANHYCYAYSINGKLKNSDDGEPSGTAGNPIQEAIIQNKLDNICIVVIRYFGGRKLGAGGLTRAYINTALKTISMSKIQEIVDTVSFSIKFDYSLNNVIQRYLAEHNIQILSTNYDLNVELIIVTNDNIDDLINLTNGKIEIKKKGIVKILK